MVAYALMRDEVERWGLAYINAAMVGVVMGREINVPTLGHLRRRFDEILSADPRSTEDEEEETQDPVRAAMLRAMGLRGVGHGVASR